MRRAFAIRTTLSKLVIRPCPRASVPTRSGCRLLGFHQSTGDNWTRESQGFGAGYAAEISRR